MIMRALFFIGLVAVLMPHEPDVGLGRPGSAAGMAAPSGIGALIEKSQSPQICSGHEQACAGGLALLSTFQNFAVEGLAKVRDDLEANRRDAHRHSSS